MLFGKNFRISGEKNVKFFEKLFLQECTNCFLRQQKRGVSVHFDEKPSFSKVFVIFQNLSDSKQHLSSFWPLNFLAGLSKLYSGVQRNISWRKPIWNNLFFWNLFFGFWTKVLGLFTKSFWQTSKEPFYVSRWTVYEKAWDKKRANNKTCSRKLFWKLSDFWWNFSGRFVKTVFYLRVTFWWKAAFASERLISNFFWHLAQTLKVLAKLLPAKFYKLLSTCLKGKIVSSNFWAKTLVLKVFVNIHDLTDS